MLEPNLIWLIECFLNLKLNTFGVETFTYASTELNCSEFKIVTIACTVRSLNAYSAS
jgi:hypothetical protein